METEEPSLGDGAYPPRYLKVQDQEQWIADHNPHILGSPEHSFWNALFYLDQSDALRDPKRSTTAKAQRIMLIVQISAAVVAAIILIASIISHANG